MRNMSKLETIFKAAWEKALGKARAKLVCNIEDAKRVGSDPRGREIYDLTSQLKAVDRLREGGL